MITRLIATSLLILNLAFPAMAGKAIDNIEACWGKTRNISGTFIQHLKDGSVVGGKFIIEHPGKMQMDYARNFGARWNIGNGVIQQSTLDQYGQRKTERVQDLGPFAPIFSNKPDFSRVATGDGSTNEHAIIRARHPNARTKGYVDFYFDRSCRLTQWVSTIEDFEHTTVLTYGGQMALSGSNGVARPKAQKPRQSVATLPTPD